MPNFLPHIFEKLQRSLERTVLREVRGDQFVSVTGRELLTQIERARVWLRAARTQAFRHFGAPVCSQRRH
jgi:hypothetical protein